MRGWIFRRALALKDFGERAGQKKLFGRRIFWHVSGLIIRLGLALREQISKYPVQY